MSHLMQRVGFIDPKSPGDKKSRKALAQMGSALAAMISAARSGDVYITVLQGEQTGSDVLIQVLPFAPTMIGDGDDAALDLSMPRRTRERLVMVYTLSPNGTDRGFEFSLDLTTSFNTGVQQVIDVQHTSLLQRGLRPRERSESPPAPNGWLTWEDWLEESARRAEQSGTGGEEVEESSGS